LNFEHFWITGLAVHSSIKTTQCIKIIIVGNGSTNQLLSTKSVSLMPMAKKDIVLGFSFFLNASTVIYENLLLKRDLMSEMISSTPWCIAKIG
jgi:hypothetical protein